MRILLATGIYPPDIGGPATYVEKLAEKLTLRGMKVTVLTYGASSESGVGRAGAGVLWPVHRVSKRGGPLARWSRYAAALRRHGAGADIVYAFSSVSCGVPLFLSHLRRPKRVLRLGGDFRWERYTDNGGELGLGEWYAGKTSFHGSMNGLLRRFDHIVFSTRFQEELYERAFAQLPLRSVIENALPSGQPMLHAAHTPFRLLSLGRFVRFKNLPSLVRAVAEMPGTRLTLAGEGPLSGPLHALIGELPREARERIAFHPPVSGIEKQRLLADHDLLVLPSFTDISPNTALEARAAGLPVLLTEETGLSTALHEAAVLRPLRTPQLIRRAVEEVMEHYPQLAARAAAAVPVRTWDDVAEEHVRLFRSLV